ncbi:MAG: phosphoribosylformylglycinamidine synthase [Culicoidibacterales bacterium]
MRTTRLFVEKKPEYNTQAQALQHELQTFLHLPIQEVRLMVIYDISEISETLLETAKASVFAEAVTDTVVETVDTTGYFAFAQELLPGQFDQRADSSMQCLRLIEPTSEAVVRCGQLILVAGDLTPEQQAAIKNYCINPIEAQLKDWQAPITTPVEPTIEAVPTLTGFIEADDAALTNLLATYGLAMTFADLKHVQTYFQSEKRNPTETELKVLDTYWSDHCRHTTFETHITDVAIAPTAMMEAVQTAYERYTTLRQDVHANKKPMSLMDMATIVMKHQRQSGRLADLEVSSEINACSIYVDVDIDGETQPWLVMFKNETHNHPTEIEPFGGASTCIGGAIRDPLSGRSYVYQAMRITGAGDITTPVEETLAGKLPQRTISKTAAHGYSSYGNQIGLATTYVKEIFHPGYVAKRMEVGAVVGAAPASHVKRLEPATGDVILMFGGRTGRDGVGGATGSSKVHTTESLTVASSEVQKGNAPEERKIQRLFRNPEVTRLIKKANDFGAGGVSVAIGELADGLIIDLDQVCTKYSGLNGTELAISESQERMAVVVAPTDVQAFIAACEMENLEVVQVATVTEEARLVMNWRGETIVNMSRAFLDTNGAHQETTIEVEAVDSQQNPFVLPYTGEFQQQAQQSLQALNSASQQGMGEMFDSTIGGSTVLLPYGGKYQLTEAECSVQKIPTLKETTTATFLAHGFDPEISKWSPFHGASYAVIEALGRLVASGGKWQQTRFSFQEYFERLNADPKRFGKPFAALLGAIQAQDTFGLPAIGGKDSMSGSFEDLDVPPTLIAFGLATGTTHAVMSPEIKNEGEYVYYLKHHRHHDQTPNYDQLHRHFDQVQQLIATKQVSAVASVKADGLFATLAKMTFGNKIGMNIQTAAAMFEREFGSFILVSPAQLTFDGCELIGQTGGTHLTINDQTLAIDTLIQWWQAPLAPIYPLTVEPKSLILPEQTIYQTPTIVKSAAEIKPHVCLPVFYGTNCEYDSQYAFEKAGATTQQIIIANQTPAQLEAAIEQFAAEIRRSQILMLSGGFSAGDEPDGSGKYIATVLQNAQIAEAIDELLARDGLILGICNGFQALIKSGLLPHGKAQLVKADDPTLFRNDNNRHVARMVQTRVTSNKSPWLQQCDAGQIHDIAISHGEGKFMADEATIAQLFANGQIATQYVDFNGQPTMDPNYNPNGSYQAIEGITSLDGRILGKMGHSERFREGVFQNHPGNHEQPLFTSGVAYFTGEQKGE